MPFRFACFSPDALLRSLDVKERRRKLAHALELAGRTFVGRASVAILGMGTPKFC